jgi:hypothetical protein
VQQNPLFFALEKTFDINHDAIGGFEEHGGVLEKDGVLLLNP